jgi:hypothetical protein
MANLSDNEKYLFYSVFGVFNPSVKIEGIVDIMDKDHSICFINTANHEVIKRVSYCQEGLDLVMASLNNYCEGAIFPDRKTILTMIGCKSIEHLQSTERCLLFREFKSFLMLLRAAFASAAMLHFLSKDDRRISEWIQLSQFPERTLSRYDYKRAEKLEQTAWNAYCESLKISESTEKWQRRVFNSMVHVNLFGLIVTEDFADESTDVPNNSSFTQNVLNVLKQQPKNDNSPKLNDLPSTGIQKIGEVYAAFMLCCLLHN